MVLFDSIREGVEYQNSQPLNIYDSSECKSLATQAIALRHLRIESSTGAEANVDSIPVKLVEDQYPGWLRLIDIACLEQAQHPYQAATVDRASIEEKLPRIIDYSHHAMAQPNEYLWGGTIGPNLDCSGLVQRAYGSEGIWVPRDAYQQEGFTDELQVSLDDPGHLEDTLQVGDLVFFGSPEKATHVGIYLGKGEYIHSSGKDKGRNGIGINHLFDMTHPVSQNYAKEFRGVGRVMQSFCP